MTHEIAVESEYKGGKKASDGLDSQAAHEEKHEARTQRHMHHSRVTISVFWGNKIIEKTQRIEQARLDVANQGCAGEEVGIPERKVSILLHMIPDKTPQRLKVESEIAPVKRFARYQYLGKRA
jgi:hypothetical protein